MTKKAKVFKKLGRTFASKQAMAEFEDIRELLNESNPEALLADGFEDALIGYTERFGEESLALYDRAKVIEIMMKRDGMSEEDAEEFFSFNIVGAGGGHVPAFAIITRNVIDRTKKK